MSRHTRPHNTTDASSPLAEAWATPRAQEKLVLDILDEVPGERILATTLGLGQLAWEAAARRPEAHVCCFTTDAHHAGVIRRAWKERDPNTPSPSGIPASSDSSSTTTTTTTTATAMRRTLVCAADFPEETYDLALMPLTSSGEAELTRELIEQAHQRLCIGGRLVTSTDNARDSWLGQEIRRWFGKVIDQVAPDKSGKRYWATKTSEPRKVKDHGCQFAFRDQGRLIQAYSRPGVFVHRRVDAGTRQLLQAMEVQSGEKVLDLGCGTGIVSLAAAFRAADVRVHAVDSSTRAVACTAAGALLNELQDVISTELNADGTFRGTDKPTYTLAVLNPPYFANHRITRLFLDAASRAVVPGGRVMVVTKTPDWYAENALQWLKDLTVMESKNYFIIEGVTHAPASRSLSGAAAAAARLRLFHP